MRPTMTDVAEKAGVSIGTVSLVLNEKPGISSELRAVVMEAAEELGYRLPGRRAARGGGGPSITVVQFASRAADTPLSGVLFNYLDSIQAYVQDKGVNLTLLTEYREDDPNSLGYRLLEKRELATDGLILAGVLNQPSRLVERALQEQVPVVVLSRTYPDLPVSTVGQDHRQAARSALDHLIALGHRTIGFVAGRVDRRFDWFDQRLGCYQETLARLDVNTDQLVSVGEDGADAARRLLLRRPDVTALFAVHDEVAVQAMGGADQLDLRLPDDLSIIGLDDSAKAPARLPALTTVGFPHRKVGQLAAELLLRQIEDPDLSHANIFVHSHLIERVSCAAPRQGSLLLPDEVVGQ